MPHPIGQKGQLVKMSLGPKSQVPDPQSRIPGPRSQIPKKCLSEICFGQQKVLAKKKFWLQICLAGKKFGIRFLGKKKFGRKSFRP